MHSSICDLYDLILQLVTQIPGGTMEESKVLRGIMLNKDVTHPKMRRYMEIS